MRLPRPLRPVFLLLVLPLLLAPAACGGGGGGGPTAPPPPPPPTRSIVVTPDTAGTTGVSIAAGAATTTTTLVLEIRANAVTDLYGLAFDLRYPNAALRYVRADAGPFLSGANLQAFDSQGTLIVGLSKLGAVAGADGSGVLMTIEFQSLATGQGTFAFSNNTAIDSSAQTLSGLTWSAGTVSVTF